MPEQVTSDNTLAVVWTDEQAAHLPKHLDPIIVEDQSSNLWELVEEELILALPPFSYHDTDKCKETIAEFFDPEIETVEEEKPNPFNVLAQLKPGK
jgi:uncharacterized protein